MNKWIVSFGSVVLAAALTGCAGSKCGSCCGAAAESATIEKSAWGKMPDGTPVELFTLKSSKGMEVKISNYGGIVTSMTAPDRSGKFEDVVLGYDKLDGYLKATPYFGCLVGRYANRIAKGQFTLDGKIYALATNNYPNTLHGGLKGFDKVVWNVVRARVTSEGPALELSYLSKDGEEGFPGNLNVTATYTLTEKNELRTDFKATTDKPTVVNLTQHSYFNLRGKGDVLGHEVYINADKFTPVDANLIPTGELRPVAGTPFDFTKPTSIGARIVQADEQLKFGNGYDHNWVLNKTPGELSLAARVVEPETGRVLEILTTEPGMQFYTGNFLDGTITGKGGWTYKFREGFAMEPQHFPDSPNQPNFPSTVLRPGQVYKNTIIQRVSALK
jgi:aldose 1-epimerase